MPRRALFLDRDGVVNVDRGYVHTMADTEWVPHIFDLAADAKEAGYLSIVITNQAGIARGYYGLEEFMSYTSWMHEEFARRQVPLLATYYCPHHPTAGLPEHRVACFCRKPKPGMIIAAKKRFNLDLSQSVLVGDTESDLNAAQAAGILQRALVIDNSLPSFVQLINRFDSTVF
ncbi:MAG: hypothetical protein ABT19_02630 [Rhodanobacter sp. SCN 68-63]|nr:MAG: hypothetical protein ABT19_02630 [Rhodanobacter sp. SCN 68-63]